MHADYPESGGRRGFAEHRLRSRVRLERCANAALSGGIVGLLLAGLALGLAGSPHNGVTDRSPAIRTFALASPSGRRDTKPEHERRAVPAQRTAAPDRPTVAKVPAVAVAQRAGVSMMPEPSGPPARLIPLTVIAPAPPPAASTSSVAAESPSALDAYRQQLWALIAARRPPGIHLDGEVGIAFDLDPDGGLRSVRIVRSSGDPMMDRLALGTVRRAAPFPRPPVRDRAVLTFEIGFRFR